MKYAHNLLIVTGQDVLERETSHLSQSVERYGGPEYASRLTPSKLLLTSATVSPSSASMRAAQSADNLSATPKTRRVLSFESHS